MKYDLIIDSRPSEVVIALLRDGLLIELHKELFKTDSIEVLFEL